MKCTSLRLGLARRLLAVSVSLAVVVTTPAFALASRNTSSNQPTRQGNQQSEAASDDLQLSSVTATPTAAGVLLEWHTNAAPNNTGFNIYRVKDGQRTRANKEIIPGVQFKAGPPALTRGGFSFSWLDRKGTADSVYFLESVDAYGVTKVHQPITPSPGIMSLEFQAAQNVAGANAPESPDSFAKQFPAAESQQPHVVNGTLQDQWAIAAQTALKISIKKAGWYRVTQPQMVAAGFNPTVDIRNLRLFVDANEVAINTSQLSGNFSSSDYIEFYGQGLDIPTTDTRVYYLLAGTTPGRRVQGDIQLDGPPPPPPPPQPPAPTSTPVPAAPPATAPITPGSSGPVLRDPIFFSWIDRDLRLLGESLRPSAPAPTRDDPNNNKAEPDNSVIVDPSLDSSQIESLPTSNSASPAKSRVLSKSRKSGAVADVARTTVVERVGELTGASKAASATTPGAGKPAAAAKSGQVTTKKSRKRSRTRKRNRPRKQFQPERHHALLSDGFVPPNFDYTIEIKDRGVYYSSLMNGEAENFFGRVIASLPVTLTLNLTNPDTTPSGSATLEVAIQGVTNTFGSPHQVNVSFNGNLLGSLNFGPQDYIVQSYQLPASQFHSGANQLLFTKISTGENCIVDYARLTYPHTFFADSGTAKFTVRGTQTLKVDGFATPLVRLIDYTDQLNVGVSKAVSEPSASGYAITVPTNEAAGKSLRLFYAIPFGQFDQPASLSLNQPSSLNLNSNAADYLIVSHKDFIASMEPLRVARSNGMIAKTVDVEDVYDEFSYGLHGPQAIKSFLEHASTHWVTPPRYIVFAGDASLDPRNYFNVGNFDFVPTKLIDTQFEETCSDDWLADFHGDPITNGPDGIADIPIGRLPVRTAADATALVNKIINFTPLVPQNAMLVADDPTGYYFNFETANDQVQSLLPPAMTVQKAYRRLEIKLLSGTVSTNSSSSTVTGTGSNFTNPAEVQIGFALTKDNGERLGTVAAVTNDTTLSLTTNANSTYSGIYGRQDDATARANIIAGFNAGRALVNYSGHGNVDVWTGGSVFRSADALALTNGNSKLSFVVVMDCLNGLFQDPTTLSLSEAFLKAPGGGAVAAFASSGKTFPDGQHEMSNVLYSLIYGGPPIALGDAIKTSKAATSDIDVRRTWIYFGDPALKIR